MKTSGVYAIVCLENGRRYVGGSTDIKTRWRRHRSNLKLGQHDSKKLQADWDKYGHKRFEFVVLESGDEPTKLEQKWLDERAEYNTLQEAHRAGRPHSEETKARMRGPRTSMANNQNSKGASRSPETRALIGAAKKGLPSKLRGRTLSEETKAKIRAAKARHRQLPLLK